MVIFFPVSPCQQQYWRASARVTLAWRPPRLLVATGIPGVIAY
jgi:hypothetical protein